MQCKACSKVVGALKKLFKNSKLRDTYKKTFNYNDIRRDRFLAQCHGLPRADISALIMSVASEKNAIRPGSLKRQIDFVDLRDLKARLTNDPALLQNTITDGPAFADQDTGDDMYPVLKQENTSSYIPPCDPARYNPSPHVIPPARYNQLRYVISVRRGQTCSPRHNTCGLVGVRTRAGPTSTIVR